MHFERVSRERSRAGRILLALSGAPFELRGARVSTPGVCSHSWPRVARAFFARVRSTGCAAGGGSAARFGGFDEDEREAPAETAQDDADRARDCRREFDLCALSRGVMDS